MARDDLIQAEGAVEKILGGGRYQIVLDSGQTVTAQLSGPHAPLPHPRDPGRPGPGRPLALRPDPRLHHLPSPRRRDEGQVGGPHGAGRGAARPAPAAPPPEPARACASSCWLQPGHRDAPRGEPEPRAARASTSRPAAGCGSRAASSPSTGPGCALLPGRAGGRRARGRRGRLAAHGDRPDPPRRPRGRAAARSAPSAILSGCQLSATQRDRARAARLGRRRARASSTPIPTTSTPSTRARSAPVEIGDHVWVAADCDGAEGRHDRRARGGRHALARDGATCRRTRSPSAQPAAPRGEVGDRSQAR